MATAAGMDVEKDAAADPAAVAAASAASAVSLPVDPVSPPTPSHINNNSSSSSSNNSSSSGASTSTSTVTATTTATNSNSNTSNNNNSNTSNNNNNGTLSPRDEDEKHDTVFLSKGEVHGRQTVLYGNSRQGAKQFQEDSFFHFQSPNATAIVAGVFDGHGGFNGYVASSCARNFCVSWLKRNAVEIESYDVEQWKTALHQLFLNMHTDIRDKFLQNRPTEALSKSNALRYVDQKGIVRGPSGDPVHGGTTATVLVLKQNEDGSCVVICANVGDSTSIYIPTHSNEWEFLTVDHGPENPDEYQRVNSLDSKLYPLKLLFVYDKTNVLRKYECPLVFLPDGSKNASFVQNPWGNGLHPTNVRYEPAVYAVTPRIVSKDTTCIAMTRALGDFYAHQFGLTCVPSVTVKHIDKSAEFTIAVASDGIWDCWKYEDLLEYTNSKLSKDTPVDALVEYTLSESISRAVTNFGAKHYDDASLITIHSRKL